MSRGGGGRGRGRGGGGGLKGGIWEHDPNLHMELDNKPSELFPAYNVPMPRGLRAGTRREIAFYRNLKDQIYQGPLYTQGRTRDPTESRKIYGEEHANSIYASKSKAEVDPFTGVPTYSMKYDQKTRSIPQLSARPFVKDFFPKELWPALDGEDGGAGRKKKLILASNAMGISTEELKAMDAEARAKALQEKLDNLATEDDAADATAEPENEEEEEEDDAFDDEYGADDYDGEGYFDGGEGDDYDDDDGGGGDYF